MRSGPQHSRASDGCSAVSSSPSAHFRQRRSFGKRRKKPIGNVNSGLLYGKLGKGRGAQNVPARAVNHKIYFFVGTAKQAAIEMRNCGTLFHRPELVVCYLADLTGNKTKILESWQVRNVSQAAILYYADPFIRGAHDTSVGYHRLRQEA